MLRNIEAHQINSKHDRLMQPGPLAQTGPILVSKLHEITSNVLSYDQGINVMANPREDPDGHLSGVSKRGESVVLAASLHRRVGGAGRCITTRQVCLDYIDTYWTDTRPQGLVDAMNSQ